ncbi:MAG TPA: hypothetical protein VMY77_07475 [Chitinophagaceae bacterium]|nr:hypothetical protein [Chitinophagaceae bacterium]
MLTLITVLIVIPLIALLYALFTTPSELSRDESIYSQSDTVSL